MEQKKKNKVFIIYLYSDKEIASQIAEKLEKQDINVWVDTIELKYGDLLLKNLEKEVSANDYIILLISTNFLTSSTLQQEREHYVSSWINQRNITLLPVIISDSPIPSCLVEYKYLDIHKNIEKGLNKLVSHIYNISEIDFSLLNYESFEKMIFELLHSLKFENLKKDVAIGNLKLDCQAEFKYFDPFGITVTENWIIEIKYYKEKRADLKTIQQLVTRLGSLPSFNKGLLITNGQLTSVSRDWLNSANNNFHTSIRIIDGTDLKRLLLQNNNLVNKYFSRNKEK